MEVNGVRANSQDSADFPRGLTSHRPLQHFNFTRCKDRRICSRAISKQSNSCILGVNSEQLQFRKEVSKRHVLLW